MRILAARIKEVRSINKIGIKVTKIRKIDFSSYGLNLNLKFLRIKLKSIKKGNRATICFRINFISVVR